MTSTAAGIAFRDRLLEHGVLVSSGVPGLYGRSGAFEEVVDGIERYVTRMGRAAATSIPSRSSPAPCTASTAARQSTRS